MKLIIATGNQGKLKEFRNLLSGLFEEVTSLGELGLEQTAEETGETFAENAWIKARSVAEKFPACAVLADDSGLSVDALHGEPGVYSARYSAEGTDAANRKKLLQAMQGQPNRSAHFTSVLVLILPDGRVLQAEGTVQGRILEEETGAEGFGYDCLFYCDELKKSFGQTTQEEKNAVSHRGRAMRRLQILLRDALQK